MAIQLNLDADVAKILEYLKDNVHSEKRVNVAGAVLDICELIWGDEGNSLISLEKTQTSKVDFVSFSEVETKSMSVDEISTQTVATIIQKDYIGPDRRGGSKCIVGGFTINDRRTPTRPLVPRQASLEEDGA